MNSTTGSKGTSTIGSDSERTRVDGIKPLIRSFSNDNLPPVCVNRAIAIEAKRGTLFYHRTERNRDSSAVRCRVTGKCKVWKTRPIDYRLPVKYGLRTSCYLTHRNSDVWLVTDPTAVVHESAEVTS